MVIADKAARIARVCGTQQVAPVTAGVGERVDLAVLATRDDDPVLAHEGREEIAGLFQRILVSQEQPAAGKYAFQFQIVDVPVPIDATVLHGAVLTDQRSDIHRFLAQALLLVLTAL